MSITSTSPATPAGYCQCGCGRKTSLAPRTVSARGWVKGEPVRFIHGHGGKRFRAGAGRPARPLAARLAERVERNEATGCHLWTGPTVNGYGKIQAGGRGTASLLAHRAAYELKHGKLPAGHSLHHVCANPLCANTAHLVPMPTPAEHAEMHRLQEELTAAILEGLERGTLFEELTAESAGDWPGWPEGDWPVGSRRPEEVK